MPTHGDVNLVLDEWAPPVIRPPYSSSSVAMARVRRARRAFGAFRAFAMVAIACASSSTMFPTASASSPAADAPPPDSGSDASSSSSSFPTALDRAFARWLTASGGRFSPSGVYSHVEGGGRGIFAKDQDVSNGDEVFSVPLDAALVVPSPRAGATINRLASETDPEWALAALLIRETALGDASPHAPFLAALRAHPPRGAHPPPRLSPAARAALEATHAGDRVDAWESRAEAGFAAVEAALVRRFPLAFPPERYTRDAFRAALAVVHAASVRFPARDVGAATALGYAAALAPIAHMLPHDPRGAEPCVVVERRDRDRDFAGSNPTGTGTERDDDTMRRRPAGASVPTFVVRVAAASRGTELACHRGASTTVEGAREGAAQIGAMSDAEAMARFGTVGPGHNLGDFLRVDLPPGVGRAAKREDARRDDASSNPASDADRSDASEASETARGRLLSGCGDVSRRALTSDGPTAELRCAVRVATANDTEVALLAARLIDDEDDDAVHIAEGRTLAELARRPVSDESEARALAALHETTAAMLDGYATSDAEDEAALAVGLSDEESESGAEVESEAESRVALVGDVREATRCRLREKLLLIDALNALRREAATRRGGTPFDLTGGEGDDVERGAAEAARTPPEGYRTAKRHYAGDL